MKKYVKKIPSEILSILWIFLATRIALTLLGVVSRGIIVENTEISQSFTGIILFDIWMAWESSGYLTIATQGYSGIEAGFFPLYSMLTWFLGTHIHNMPIAGILISNVCLIIACYYLYKIANIDSDPHTAGKSVKYLILMPASFLLSALLPNSLFLMLILMCFYYSRVQNWRISGIAGFFASLTHPLGALIIIPIAYEWTKANHKLYNLKNALFLSLIPVGLLVFFIYSYLTTGNPITYMSLKEINAFKPTFTWFHAIFAAAFIIPMVIYYRYIRWSYLIFSAYMLLIPIFLKDIFPNTFTIIFPYALLFSKLSKNKNIDTTLTIIFSLLQGFMFLFWTVGSPLYI